MSTERVLSSTDRNSYEGKLTLEERTEALKQLKVQKAPGIDGLSTELYRAFWSIMGSDFVDMVDTVYELGILSLSQQTEVIRMLYKKGDRNDLNNWRPISLLNADCKIITKTLANQLNQSWKLLSSHVRRAQVVSLDQKKAFDHVDLFR